MSHIYKLIIALAAIICTVSLYYNFVREDNLPIVAIANYGAHSSLHESIRGIQESLAQKGFHEGKNIHFEISDVNFDSSLIMQMLSKLKASKPKILVALTTPVAQAAKNTIKDTPIVFADITDPVESGLIKNHDTAANNITGAADTQDLKVVIEFAKSLIPNLKNIGILYATGESNDLALVKMMEKAAKSENIKLIAIPVETARDVPIRMIMFKDNVDVIYVGSSGPIQPSLPTIVSIAEEMRIPVLNMNAEEVKENKVFASCGVSYYKVGVNAGKIIADILGGKPVSSIAPIYPEAQDHEAFISRKRALKIGYAIPNSLTNVSIID